MGEVIVTPPRNRDVESSEETQEEIQQENSSESDVIEIQPKEENMNSEEITSKANKPWIWMVAGAGLILALLIGTNHLVWTDRGPVLLSMGDAYEAGKARAVRDIEAMSWYSRVWRGFTGDYHSK